MLTPYFRDADTTLLNLTNRFATKLNISDTTNMLTPYFRDADTTLLNLTNRFAAKLNYTDTSFLFTQSDTSQLNLSNRFAAKQNTLDGTGFVKASGTNITYDNSSYLRTGLADSTYLKLTGGELSSNLGVIGNISFGSKSVYSGQYTRYLQSSETSPYRDLFIGSLGTIGTWAGRMHFQTSYNTETPTTAMTINEFGNINMNGTLAVQGDITENGNNVLTSADTASLSSRIDGKVSLTGDQTISGTKTFNNLVNITNQMTISGSVSGANILLGKNTSTNGVGDVTVGTGLNLSGSNVLTASGTDTTFLSDRINLKYNSSGGTISGAVTLSTTSATPTSLLGKDGSNVVGTVTTVAQTGLFGRGSVTNAVTDANGNITVAHGFNFTPIMAFANLPASTTNIVNVKEVDGTNITFIVRDGATNNVLNTQSVTKIEFFAIK
jgi:hypothetical protein